MSPRKWWCLAIGAAGCFPRIPPEAIGSVSTAERVSTHARGAWVEAFSRTADGTYGLAAGELVAASRDSLWVFGASGLIAVPTRDISSGRLVRYDPEAPETGKFAAWGGLSTATHGWWLAASLPVWMLAGGLAAQVQLANGVVPFVDDTDYANLAMWARFPVGLPKGLDRATLTAAPRPP